MNLAWEYLETSDFGPDFSETSVFATRQPTSIHTPFDSARDSDLSTPFQNASTDDRANRAREYSNLVLTFLTCSVQRLYL